MKKETLKKILNFLSENEGKTPQTYGSIEWKILFNEPFTKEELNVKGDLDLEFSKITSLPEGLVVGGNLYLYESKIESLPEGLEVGGFLDLGHSNITSLPKGLKVRGRLFISPSPLKKYTDEQLREMVKPGFIQGKIKR
jgi:hypothetical protein